MLQPTLRARERCGRSHYDTIVVGAGPNGISAAIFMLQASDSVLLLEAQSVPGGGCRSLELTLPGYKNDICSAVHPLGYGSPFFRTLPLADFGLDWINPESAYIHAYQPGKALVIDRDLDSTARNLGAGGDSFKRLMRSIYPDWNELCASLLDPVRLVRHVLPMARFGTRAILSARQLADGYLAGDEAKAVFAGVAAHSSAELTSPCSAAVGLSLGIAAHALGWPIPKGGAQTLTGSLLKYFGSLGGELITDCPVRSISDLPSFHRLFFDVTPGQFADIAKELLSKNSYSRLSSYKYGPGCFKMDWAMDGPIPWSSDDFTKSPTVHLSGTFEEIAEAESMVARGRMPEKPYVLLAQPSLFDPTRAPEGKHVVWAYCHVPTNYERDVGTLIEAQIERFAPGFKNRIIARSKLAPQDLHRHNENHIGGDIHGGSLALPQLLFRPAPRLIPYKTALPNVYLCSSSTPPGSGVHGMCGYYAAWCARYLRGKG